MNNKITIALVIVAILALGAYFFPQASYQSVGSTAGATNTTAKIAQQIVTTSSSTIFAILNTDASDRTIASANIFLANSSATTTLNTITCATSTTPYDYGSNSNFILHYDTSFNSGTTTGATGLYVATSSPGMTGTTTASTLPVKQSIGRVWKTGTYLVCVDVTSGGNSNLFSSGTTGYVGFSYFAN